MQASQISLAPRRFLVQRADRLGDTVFILPVLLWLRARFPDSHIAVLCQPATAEFLRFQHCIDQIITIPTPTIRAVISILGEVRDGRFDTYISLWNEPALAWLGRLAGIPNRIGDATNLSIKWLYTHTVRQRWEDMTRHQIEFNLDLLKPLGYIDSSEFLFKLDVPPESGMRIFDLIESHHSQGRKTAVIFNGTGGSNSPIPDDRIIALTQRLSKRNFVPVLLGNVSADSPVARFRSPEAINLTNQTSMGDLVAWLAGCDVVIGADTGPMHIAAAAETPMVVVTRGKSNFPTRFGPWGSFVTILRREYECPQVATRLCTDSDCPALPSVDEIENAVLEIPSRRSARNPNALRELFFMHSIRVLVPCRNQVEWHRINALRRRFEKQRLIVVPYFWDGTIGTLCKELLRVNATVVMSSDLSLWQAKWTRRWMGIRYQYIPPIIIRRSVLVSDSVAELVSLYKECWRSGVGII